MTRSQGRTNVRQYANNEFIGENMEFDRLMDQLRSLRSSHFNTDAEKERHWGEVGSVKHVNGLLRQALEHYGIKA